MALLSVLLLLGALGFLLLLHLWIAGSAHSRRLRPWLAQPGRGLSQAELQKLPCFEFEVGGSSCTDSSCAVCLEEFEKSGGEKCKTLPACNHTFHAKCLDAWLSRTPICPICRTTAGDRRESGQSCALVPISCHSDPIEDRIREECNGNFSSFFS